MKVQRKPVGFHTSSSDEERSGMYSCGLSNVLLSRASSWASLVMLLGAFLLRYFNPTEAQADPLAPFNVGFQILDLYAKRGQNKQILAVAVWYPTTEAPHEYNYGGPTRGMVAFDARPDPAGAPYPLFVFSHGYGGSGLSALFLTEALASRGWIVACPDHNDAYSAVRIRTGQQGDLDRRGFLSYLRQIASSGPADRVRYLYRLEEMQLVLGHMLASESFGPLIDKGKVAVGGHSFGGFTALGLCGTIPEQHDPRIKAVLLFSTGAGSYLFKDEELSAVRMPSMLFMGEKEKGQLRGSKSMLDLQERIFRNLSPPKYLLVVKGGTHFSFNNRFSQSLGARLMSGSETQFEVIRRYSMAFLERHVLGKEEAEAVLRQKDPLITDYWSEPLGSLGSAVVPLRIFAGPRSMSAH
ncbi:MAG: hypothetical protein WHX93_16345 [bacterium]